jgi:hypothetical protein
MPGRWRVVSTPAASRRSYSSKVGRFSSATAAYPRRNLDGVLLRQNRHSHETMPGSGRGRRYRGESGRPSDLATYRMTPGAGTGAEWLRQTHPALPSDAPEATLRRSATTTGTPAPAR